MNGDLYSQREAVVRARKEIANLQAVAILKWATDELFLLGARQFAACALGSGASLDRLSRGELRRPPTCFSVQPIRQWDVPQRRGYTRLILIVPLNYGQF